MIARLSLAALALAGTALAQVPPPPAGTASTAGLVTRISLEDIKAIYDAAGVAYQVQTPEGGMPYLSAAPEGYAMFATLIDCPEAGKPVDCGGVALESGVWDHPLTTEDLNVINSSYLATKAFLNAKGQPGLIYSFSIAQGVGPTYIRGALKGFVAQMKYFGSFEWVPKAAEAAPAPTPAVGTFSVAPDAGASLKRPLAGGTPQH